MKIGGMVAFWELGKTKRKSRLKIAMCDEPANPEVDLVLDAARD
jgi:hypothetical protein